MQAIQPKTGSMCNNTLLPPKQAYHQLIFSTFLIANMVIQYYSVVYFECDILESLLEAVV